tara:strand:- start:38 stop:358 length:321 start_codon:yes stop_codon:yes gene_type:complete
MDLHEQDDLRGFLVSLFGNQAQAWPMSDKMFNLTFELLAESASCSSLMDLVPRPFPIGGQPISWLKKEIRSAFLRSLKNDSSHYVVCIRAAALQKVREFQLAAMGV